MILEVHVLDLDLDGVAGLHNLFRLVHAAAPGHLGDVHEAFDAGQHFDKGAKGSEAHNAALNDIADHQLGGGVIPGVALSLLEGEGNAGMLAAVAALLLGNLEELDLHFLTHTHGLVGLDHTGPGQLGKMDHAFNGGSDFDESAEGSEAGHLAFNDVPFLHFGEELLEAGFALAVNEGAVAHNDVAAAALNAGDEELEGLSGQALRLAGSHLASGAESGLAENLDMIAALAGVDDPALNRNAGVLGVLNGSHAGAVHGAGKDDFLGSGFGDVGFDFVADLHREVALIVDEVLAIHNAVNLHTHVHEDAVVGHIDNGSGNLVPLFYPSLSVFLARLKHFGKILARILSRGYFLISHIRCLLKKSILSV